MWTLILLTVLAIGQAGGLSSTAIPGFSSLSACEKAGHELVTKAPETKFFYGQTRKPLFGEETSKLYSVTYEIVRYGYQCIEVK